MTKAEVARQLKINHRMLLEKYKQCSNQLYESNLKNSIALINAETTIYQRAVEVAIVHCDQMKAWLKATKKKGSK